MFRSSLTIIRPVCESCFTNAGYILGSHYVYNFASVYLLYKYIKVRGRNSEWYKNYMWMLGKLLRTLDCVCVRRKSVYHLVLNFNTSGCLQSNTSLSSLICNFLYSPLTSSVLGPHILLNTLFTNTLNLRFSFNVSDQVSHPYKTGKIIVLYILIL